MKTRKILTAAVMVMFSYMSHAQITEPPRELAIDENRYHTAFGVRAGETSGLTIKQFINDRSALEGILGFWYRGFSATLMYEHHTPAFEVSGLNWYYGIGGHGSLYADRYVFYHARTGRVEHYRSGAFGLGVDGIFGIEYKIPNAPIAASLDFKPYMEVISTGNVWMSIDPGLGVKVVF